MLIINKYVIFSIKPAKVQHVYSILMLCPMLYRIFFVASRQNRILTVAAYPSLAPTGICQVKARLPISREAFGLHFWEVTYRITSKGSREKGVGEAWLAPNASSALCQRLHPESAGASLSSLSLLQWVLHTTFSFQPCSFPLININSNKY